MAQLTPRKPRGPSGTWPLIRGINYPWTVFAGRPNYGCDFGRNIWGSQAGVTAHAGEIQADFAAMAAMGVEVVRWFVFTDGRGGVRWDDRGRVVGLADGALDDLDAALAMASDAGLRLCLVLFDFSWMMHREERDAAGRTIFVTRPDALATSAGRSATFAALIDPLLARYGTRGPCAALGRAIHSFDVINEPDWVTRGLALDRRRTAGTWRARVRRPFSAAELRAFVRGVADRVHAETESLVTVGSARARFAHEWDDPAYGLDFIQVHLYPDARHPKRDRPLVGQPCRILGVSKPVLIGECPANGDAEHPPGVVPAAYSLADYIDTARAGGYLGAWPWSFKGVDGYGAVRAEEFVAAHLRGS
jgi:hypothetical protein